MRTAMAGAGIFYLDGQPDAGAQAAAGRLMKRQIAPLTADHVPGDSQAQTGTSRVEVARTLKTDEGPEYFFTLLGVDPGPIVIDQDFDALAPTMSRHVDLLAETPGVAEQVSHRAVQRLGPQH